MFHFNSHFTVDGNTRRCAYSWAEFSLMQISWMETRLLSASNHASEQMSYTILGFSRTALCLWARCFLWAGRCNVALQCLWERLPCPPHAQSEILRLRYRTNKMALFHGMVNFWGVFHWVLYLVPGTFLVPPRPGVPSDPYSYQNMTCKLCWSLNWPEKIAITASWTCDMRPNIDPARFKSAQPAKDRTQLLFEQTHIFVSTTK